MPRHAREPDEDEVDAEAAAFEEAVAGARVRSPTQEAAAPKAKPPLLRALEAILADPEEIRLDVQKLRVRLRRKHRGRELDRAVARALVSAGARRTMLAGGAGSLAAVLPGPGAAVAVLGGAAADAALSLKYELEMVQGIAWAYGHDLSREEERRACLVITGVGALAEVGKTAGLSLSSRAFVRVVDDFLRGNAGRVITALFRLLGLRLAPRTLARLVPFGLGLSASVLMNRALARAIGARAIAYFEAARQ